MTCYVLIIILTLSEHYRTVMIDDDWKTENVKLKTQISSNEMTHQCIMAVARKISKNNGPLWVIVQEFKFYELRNS